jgi:hypothetical protein
MKRRLIRQTAIRLVRIRTTAVRVTKPRDLGHLAALEYLGSQGTSRTLNVSLWLAGCLILLLLLYFSRVQAPSPYDATCSADPWMSLNQRSAEDVAAAC